MSVTRDVVVYAGGGGMRGIFGAGVLHALEGLRVGDRVEAHYGISAGAFNITHFALGTTPRAMEWYLHHVPEQHLMVRAPTVAALRGEDVIDLSHAARVLDAERLVDAEALSGCAVPVWFGVVSRGSLEFRWLDARRPDAIRRLLASSTIFPFVHDPVPVDGVSYVDGGFRETIAHARLRREHPGAKLLLVLSTDEEGWTLHRMAVGALLKLRDEQLAEVWLETIARAPAEMAEALAAARTLVLKPDAGFPVRFATTDAATLAYGFWLGYRAVLTRKEQILGFLEA